MLSAINNDVREDMPLEWEYALTVNYDIMLHMSFRRCTKSLEKHSNKPTHSGWASENDSCYECIRLRPAVVTNYQMHNNK